MRTWLLALLSLASCAAPVSSDSPIIRLEKSREEPFTSFVRSIDAEPYRGRLVVATARVKGIGITKGPNGVWLRADGADRKLLGFASSYSKSVIGDSDWVERDAILDVSTDAERIVYGAVTSSGTLLIDGLRVEPIESFRVEHPTPLASDYLEDALEKVRRLAYYSGQVNWPRARAVATVLASGARTPADTYDAIRYVLASLGDHHSHFVEPAVVREGKTSTARDFEVTGAILSGIGYVALPGYNGQNAERSAAYASAIENYIDAARADHACRWIVDLRNDIGGNMSPMLAGLHALLGDAPLGYFHNRAGDWIAWSAGRSGRVIADMSHDPVAVITGRKTASAGEAVALSFRGRLNTRSFGAPTAGHSTANQPVPLSDGAVIALTTGLMADRNRNVASGRIQPDAIVDVPDTVQLGNDPAVRAAVAWLETQPCAGRSK